MMISIGIVTDWMRRLAVVYEDNKEYLTELDSAIGDADHGINMARGFAAVAAVMDKDSPQTLAAVLKAVSMALIKNVGGASGPLYGTLFMKMLPKLSQAEAVAMGVFVQALEDGVEGVKKMGKSEAGEKTMLDAWLPALDALRQGVEASLPDRDAMGKAAEAAEQGMLATVPMLATKGRASYLGERSIGHQDPGATSTWLMIKTLHEVLQDR